MSTFLVILITLKAICLIFCWKAIVIANKRTAPPSSEIDDLQQRMSKLVKENENLSKQLQAIKEKKSL